MRVEHRTPRADCLSSRDDWGTPPELLDRLQSEVGPFAVDLAARADNRVAPVWLGPGSPISEDSLTARWRHDLGRQLGAWWWCNPPYGRDVREWTRRCTEASRDGARIVCLLPARTDVRWFGELSPLYVSEVRLLLGRLTFVGAPAAAPFPSMLVFFRRSEGIRLNPRS